MSHSGSCGQVFQDSSPVKNENALNRERSGGGSDGKEEMIQDRSGAINSESGSDSNDAENEGFFNMVSHAQRNRMDDQRCNLGRNETPRRIIIDTSKTNCERPIDELLDMLADKQGQRLDDQRVTCNNLPGLQMSDCYVPSADEEIKAE